MCHKNKQEEAEEQSFMFWRHSQYQNTVVDVLIAGVLYGTLKKELCHRHDFYIQVIQAMVRARPRILFEYGGSSSVVSPRSHLRDDDHAVSFVREMPLLMYLMQWSSYVNSPIEDEFFEELLQRCKCKSQGSNEISCVHSIVDLPIEINRLVHDFVGDSLVDVTDEATGDTIVHRMLRTGINQTYRNERMDVNRVYKVISYAPQTLLVKNKIDGFTPLHIACHNSSIWKMNDGIDLIEGIIMKSPEAMTMKCIMGNNPIHLVCMSMTIDYRVIELLLDYSDRETISMLNNMGKDPFIVGYSTHKSKGIHDFSHLEILFARRVQIIIG